MEPPSRSQSEGLSWRWVLSNDTSDLTAQLSSLTANYQHAVWEMMNIGNRLGLGFSRSKCGTHTYGVQALICRTDLLHDWKKK